MSTKESFALQEASQMESLTSEAQISAVPHETQLQYRGRVIVGQDGNGITAEGFATTASGDLVRYFMVVVAEGADRVLSVTITLNNDVVIQSEIGPDRNKVEVALNPTGGDLNTILIAARDEPGASARVAIFAVRPVDVPVAGLSVLPSAMINDVVRTSLAVHNVDAVEIGVRIAFFEPDGTLAGRSAPKRLARHATMTIDLNDVAASLGLTWTQGAVHVEWVARGSSRVSTVAGEERVGPSPDGSLQVIGVRTLGLDDYRPRPVTAAAAEEFLGQLQAGAGPSLPHHEGASTNA